MILFNNCTKQTYINAYNIFKSSHQNKINHSTIKNLNIYQTDKSHIQISPLQYTKILFKSSYKFSNNNVVKQAFNQIINHKYSRLCRWDKPIGALLLYWPCLWGLQAGAHGLLMTHSLVPLYLLFLMGSWTSRSAGCIINDYLDKDFDKNVQRCKNRPLASGQVTTPQAAKLLFWNLCGGLLVLTQMNINSLIATFMILPISALYPLAKRYVKHPQAVLASAFNSGVIICALTVNPTTPCWSILLPLYGAGICWTMMYDTIYAFQDIDDDKKLGLKSTAIQWQQQISKKMNQMLATSLLLTSSLAYFDFSYIYSLPIFMAAHVFLKLQLNKLDIKNKKACHNFFLKNNIFGILIFMGLLIKRLVQQLKIQKKQQRKQKKK